MKNNSSRIQIHFKLLHISDMGTCSSNNKKLKQAKLSQYYKLLKVTFQKRGCIALGEESIAKKPKWFYISKMHAYKEPHYFRCSMYCKLSPMRNSISLCNSGRRFSKQKHNLFQTFGWFIQCCYFHVILFSYTKK